MNRPHHAADDDPESHRTSERPSRDATSLAHGDGDHGIAGGDGAFYGLLVESVQDYAIFVLSPTGIVRSWNAGAERIKGYAAHEIVGRSFSLFYSDEEQRAEKPARELEIADRDGRFEEEGWRLRKDGTPFWANVVITALRSADGALVGFAKVTRDLTERRQTEQRNLVEARRASAAEATNRVRSEFLATLSHELRTPLNAIGGYAELMQAEVGGPVSPQHREYLDRIVSSQKHLLVIINDLLNYSQIEAGHFAYEVRPVPLRLVVDDTLPMVMPQAAVKRITIVAESGSAPLFGSGDQHKVEQIVLNLLSNAVKFTPTGGRIVISCESLAGRVAISVSDTGPGVPQEMAEAIFEPFVQLGRSLAAPQEGTGLGLAISREMARAMGGDLLLRATKGGGATFTLYLPVAAPDEQAGAP